jgi:hypothetical protein
MPQDSLAMDMSYVKRQTEGVRFSLKKRPIRDSNNVVNISSYNSDFLTGLFADVAKVSDVTDTPSKTKRRADVISADEGSSSERMTSSCLSSKKSRTSLKKCLSRVQSSAKNLSRLCAASPKGINEIFRQSDDSQDIDRPANSMLNHHKESLQFQLSCVSEPSDSGCCSSTPKSTVENAAKIAFPNLPATVSDSSCHAGLTRANLVRQASVPENPKKESFGWFVDLDDNHKVEVNPSLPYAVSSDSLAFQAHTAPKRICDEAELEWAQAADTIDDVLGDFF